MGRRAVNPITTTEHRDCPATSPESRDCQMIHLAYDAAEQQLRNGTASAQVITYFLKLGTEREKVELEKIKSENRLAEAKVRAIDSEAESKIKYEEALNAFRRYSGGDDNGEA